MTNGQSRLRIFRIPLGTCTEKVLLSYERDSKMGFLHRTTTSTYGRPDLVPELEEVKIRRPGKKRYEGTSYLSLDARSVYLRHTTASVPCREGGTTTCIASCTEGLYQFSRRPVGGRMYCTCIAHLVYSFLLVVCVCGSNKSR